MIYILTDGEYSDYTIDRVLEGPEVDLKEIHRNWAIATFGPMPTYIDSAPWQDPTSRYAWSRKVNDVEAFSKHLQSLGFKVIEYREFNVYYRVK